MPILPHHRLYWRLCGPNLKNVGNWMNPAWIEEWLKDPQSLVPDSIEPRRNSPTKSAPP